MKLNWGFGIFIFILLFMVFILGLVYKCSLQKVDLVSEKYYEQELNYQQQVNKLNNAAALNESLEIQFNEEEKTVNLQYPSNTDLASLAGNINFFKPDDSSLDFNIDVKGNAEKAQVVSVSKLKKGWWAIQVNWTASGTSYYKEEKILIN